jgi:hypothetical protein
MRASSTTPQLDVIVGFHPPSVERSPAAFEVFALQVEGLAFDFPTLKRTSENSPDLVVA